jgi:ABC-2 type transport system ATP-binding protein
MPAIEVRDLHKHYGRNHAVRGVSFVVEPGEVFALLGPNGAGKSTTVEILEGHREASSGSVSVLGYDPATAGREFRDRIGIVLQLTGSERELTPREIVDLYGAPYRRRRSSDELLELVGLDDKAEDRVKTLSGGQQRRLDLAVGLVGEPEVLFLDEPTTGFDPSARRRSWELIDRLRSLGTTILLTTHYMDEAQYLADRVAVIADGRIVASGRPSDLGVGGGGVRLTVVEFRVPHGIDLPESIAAAGVLSDGVYQAATAAPTALAAEVTGWAASQGIELDGFSVTRPTLEDVYLELTEEAPTGE